MRVLIAPDGFGGTLTAREAASAVHDGWLRAAPGDDLRTCPLSDGGPGFVFVVHLPIFPLREVRLLGEPGHVQRAQIEAVVSDIILEKQPSKQFATVEQIAGAVLYLCSDAAAQVTGTTISVDGGWTAA